MVCRVAVLDCAGRVDKVRIDRHFVLVDQLLLLRVQVLIRHNNGHCVSMPEFVIFYALRAVAPWVVLLCDQEDLRRVTRCIYIGLLGVDHFILRGRRHIEFVLEHELPLGVLGLRRRQRVSLLKAQVWPNSLRRDIDVVSSIVVGGLLASAHGHLRRL